MSEAEAPIAALQARVVAEQVRAHYAQVPAMVTAPTAGGLFTAWVLWDAVDNRHLVIGMAAVILLSAVRLVLWSRYRAAAPAQAATRHWKVLAVAAALLSGCIWGSAALVLYPPRVPGFEVYLLVLLTLLPIVPVAALAAYMPSFYAYYVPCTLPFVWTLATADSKPERMTALLLVMMFLAMSTFARRYANGLAEAHRLKLQMAEQAQALEQAIQHKSRFIAAASHDLRQPVHAMGLFVESLRQGGGGPAGAVTYIESSLRTLRAMLDDMLQISRLDARVVAPRPRDFDAGELLRRLQAEYAPLAARQGLRWRCHVQDAVLHSDPALLERMLRNLLSNALKFTRSGGVALVCRAHGPDVRLQVIDTGCGIAEHQQHRVFEEFSQVDDAARNEAKGLGLGLAIVQRLGRLLGHDVQLRSTPGRGSVFTLVVARGQGPAGPLDVPAPADLPGVGPPLRILVLDDDEAVAAATAALLRQWGHAACVARSTAQALAALGGDDAAIDLLIVDYRLADGESGLDAIGLLQQRLGHRVPAIVVTGDTAPQRIRESFAAGHPLLHKPVDPQRLRACVAASSVQDPLPSSRP